MLYLWQLILLHVLWFPLLLCVCSAYLKAGEVARIVLYLWQLILLCVFWFP